MDIENVGECILVPLDGSPLAEQALPVAIRLATAMRRPLALVRIIPPDTWVFSGPNTMIPAETYQDILDNEDRTANEYIAHAAEMARKQGVTVTALVGRGEAALALLDLYPSQHVGLVVMTTHGRTGVARVALGSVADQLVRHSHVPVLLLRTPVGEGRLPLERAIIPLDGSLVAEASLDVARKFAGTVAHEITLIRVVDPDRVQPEAESGSENAEEYLERVRERLAEEVAGRGCVVRAETLIGDPAQQIIRRAERDCDLVILATRGQAGARRLIFGSAADRVLHDTTTPLLLIHPAIAEN